MTIPTSSTEALFQPFACKSLHLPNRIVMAPMTRLFSPDGIPTQAVADYYRRRAEGDVGLIVTEGTVIDRPAARNDPNIPLFYGAALEVWQAVVDQVHAAGGRIAPQIWHVGGAANPSKPWQPQGGLESPSGFIGADTPTGRVMSEEDIADTIAGFGRAAAAARRIGFDAVEIHAAHGYLIDQFFWAHTNRRTDHWGGASLAERSRFAIAVVKAMRAELGPDLPLILRVSQWKQQNYRARLAETPDELRQWLEPLAEAGIDIFHCSQRRYWEPEFAGSDLNFAGWAKKVTGKPTITVGSVGLSGEFLGAFRGEGAQPAGFDDVIRRLEREEFDLVAVGRALLTDWEWPIKVRDGRFDELRPFAREDLAVLS
jgi:2,4-dienoyl-CoA reductase-like NADH-dependent reductase (Old Yellow Enzyme family)